MKPRRWPLPFGLALGLATMALGFALGSDPIEQWQRATRYTARAGFFLFILVFAASALVRLWPNALTKAVLRDRRWWGLGFAASHTVHLYCFTSLFSALGEPIPLVTLLGGGLAYVLLYLMAATSNRAAMKALGRNWKRLHKIGIYYLWFIFLQSYAGRIFEPETRIVGIVFTTMAFAALGLRIGAWRRSRKR